MLNPTTIKEYAYSLGFDIARITTAGDFPEAERVIKERIAEGLMDGLPWFTAERCEVSCHPDALLPEAKSIITLAMFYLTEQPGEIQDGVPRGRISRYAWGDDYHEIIKPRLQQFATWLREYARNEMCDEVETRLFVDTGRMVDRAVAQRAGLGWYGKNTNILTKGWGSWIFLAEIVTNLPLQPDTPVKTNCGSCEICLHACPTQALPAPYVLDNTRCISFLTIELRGSIPLELRPLMGNMIFGCDICQEVCPVNITAEKRLGLRGSKAQQSESSVGSSAEFTERVSIPSCPPPIMKCNDQDRHCHPERSEGSHSRGTEILRGVYPRAKRRAQDDRLAHLPILVVNPHYRPTAIPDNSSNFHNQMPVRPRLEFRPRAGVGSNPELIPLLSLTEEQFRERFRGSPIRRTKRRGLLRNVCVALGNSGDRQAVPALTGALHDYEPLVRGHAAWALGRLGGEQAKQALQDALIAEEDEEVCKEIRCALEEF